MSKPKTEKTGSESESKTAAPAPVQDPALDEMLRKILSVPKIEIDRRDAEWREGRRTKAD